MRRACWLTSLSQAEPSPRRHCWISWESCSNVASALNLQRFPAYTIWNEKRRAKVPPGAIWLGILALDGEGGKLICNPLCQSQCRMAAHSKTHPSKGGFFRANRGTSAKGAGALRRRLGN